MMSVVFPAVSNKNFISSRSQMNLDTNNIFTICQNKLKDLQKEQFLVKKITPYYSNKNPNPLFYFTELEPNGYIIVTNNIFLRPILAYSFTSFELDSEKYDSFIEFIKTDLQLRLDESNEFEKESNFINEWNTFLENTDTSSIQSASLYEQWPPEGYSETEGWIETQWHQDSPFNDLCPIDLESGMRGIAGCPAVTMAQIFNYHQTINDVSFNDSDDYYHNYGQRFRIDDDYEEYGFPSFPELNNYLNTIQTHFDQDISLTDTDKAALTFACGTAATQSYSPESSGTFGVSQAFDAYKKFNCDETELLTESDTDLYDRIIQNVKTGLPVHLAIVNDAWNSGHNLIIDGYKTDNYYHLNFGWGGTHDGWYDLTDELPYELTVIEGAIVDILKSTDSADLTTTGSIQLTDINPGSNVNGSFTIQNIGNTDSSLTWEIESYPTWGIWDFSQQQGTNLTPDQGEITIDVTIQIPEEKATTFSGGIKIINQNSSNDFEVIALSITTPKTKQNSFFDILFDNLNEKFSFFLMKSLQLLSLDYLLFET